MYVFLVVFHGAELKNKCFDAWNCTVCPFSVGNEVFLGLNQGGGMLDLEFFQKKFSLQNSFLSDANYVFTVFLFWSILGEVERAET